MQCEVPIVAPELRREESVTQIADALRQLDKVASEIIGRVNTRVENQRKALQDVETRVKLAQTKVDKLKGSKKAIQVFSCSKYPVTEMTSYEPLFKSTPESEVLRRTVRSEKCYSEELKPADQKAIKDKLNFFRVARPSKKSRMLRAYSMEEELESGLGDPPPGITAASSYLLFNSSTNPYTSHRKFDPLDAPTRRVAEEAEPSNLLADAPASLGGSELVNRLVPKSYAYCPDLGEVPELDIPVYLPDLPGVADISFDQTIGSIAPSLPNVGDVLPDLPDIVEDVATPGAPAAPPPPPAAALAAPPPPPPPPPPPNVPAPPPPPPAPAAPPPPPAPSAPAPPPPPPPPSQGAPKPPEGAPAPQDGRGDLLSAIRNANKNKLKSVEERKRDKKEEIKKTKESGGGGGGDMMSDLLASLNRRRKGISGDKPDSSPKPGPSTSGERVGAMDRVSAMIPPPRPRTDTEDTDNNSDTEWE